MLAPAHAGHLEFIRAVIRRGAIEGSFDPELAHNSRESEVFFANLRQALLGGRFVDRLVREGGQWKIKHRTAMRDWSVAIPLTHDWDSSHTLMPGARSNDDASFAVLGAVHGG